MQNNSQYRSSRGRYFDDRSRRHRRNDGGSSHSNRTSSNASRSHQNSLRRTRSSSHSYRNQNPYNTYGRDQLAQHYSQNAYNDSRRQYHPSESTARFNDPYYYDNSGAQYYSQDVPWGTYQQVNDYSSRFPYYPPEAAWGSFQQANAYSNTQYYPPNQNNWASLEIPSYENAYARSESSRRDSPDLPFWWEDNSDATKLLHEYFWRPNTGGEIRCIVCGRNYTTVTGSGESVMSSGCGHLFCTGCLDYNNNFDLYSSYCWICNVRVTDLWKIFM